MFDPLADKHVRVLEYIPIVRHDDPSRDIGPFGPSNDSYTPMNVSISNILVGGNGGDGA